MIKTTSLIILCTKHLHNSFWTHFDAFWCLLPHFEHFELSVPTDNPIDDWGTKWNAVQDEYPENYEVITLPCDDNDNRLEYEFKTAWCPPYKYIETVSKKYDNIEFELSDYKSSITYKNGSIIDEIMYSDTDDSESE